MSLAPDIEMIGESYAPAPLKNISVSKESKYIEPLLRPSNWGDVILGEVRSEQMTPLEAMIDVLFGGHDEQFRAKFALVSVNRCNRQSRRDCGFPAHFDQSCWRFAVVRKAIMQDWIGNTNRAVHYVGTTPFLAFEPQAHQMKVGSACGDCSIGTFPRSGSGRTGSPILESRDNYRSNSDDNEKTSIGRFSLCACIAVIFTPILIGSINLQECGWCWSGRLLYVATILGLLTDLGAWGFGNVLGFWIWLLRAACGA